MNSKIEMALLKCIMYVIIFISVPLKLSITLQTFHKKSVKFKEIKLGDVAYFDFPNSKILS